MIVVGLFAIGVVIGFLSFKFFGPDLVVDKPTYLVNSFETCAAAGNPVMESYPRQCRAADGKVFVEVIGDQPVEPVKRYVSQDVNQCKLMFFGCDQGEEVFYDNLGCGCQPATSQDGAICTAQYDPVCGEVQVYCIKAPCPPLKQTFSNRCVADNAGAFNIVAGECQ